MYRPLPELLAQAKELGMTTTVTTNGMLAGRRALSRLEGVLDMLAVSIDGVPERHNRIRRSEKAFHTVERKLPGLRASGIPFGFLFTLTQFNLDELDWVVKFAEAEGAKMVQVHPLEEVGRAGDELVGSAPDGRERMMAFIEYLRVQAGVGEGVRIHLDLADVVALRRHPEVVFAGPAEPDSAHKPLADLLSPLVVEIDGTVVPLQFGFPRRFALGNLHESPLRVLADRWRRVGQGPLRELCTATWAEVTTDDSAPLINWYQTLAGRALRSATPVSLSK
jgi:MoaA/NifB/PqqE/SkfB family radical SAM enzyme